MSYCLHFLLLYILEYKIFLSKGFTSLEYLTVYEIKIPMYYRFRL